MGSCFIISACTPSKPINIFNILFFLLVISLFFLHFFSLYFLMYFILTPQFLSLSILNFFSIFYFIFTFIILCFVLFSSSLYLRLQPNTNRLRESLFKFFKTILFKKVMVFKNAARN